MDKFKADVEKYLAPHKNEFNYENLVNNHTDVDRFGTWISDLEKYTDFKDKTIFSSGCGSAGDLFLFMERGAKKVYGVEVDEGLVNLAISRFKNSKYNNQSEFKLYNGDVLPYPDKNFDIIFSMHVIEHTSNPEGYLKELFRVLKPNGVLFMDLPNRFFPLEQHTLLPFIHYLPWRIRDFYIKFITNPLFAKFESKDFIFKMQSLQKYKIPYSHDILNIFNKYKDEFKLKKISMHYIGEKGESYDIKSSYWIGMLGKAKKHRTLRIIVGKEA